MPLDLTRLLLREAHRMNFFQAAHLLERLHSDAGQVGTGAELASEPVRFETDDSIAFPTSEIRAVLPPMDLASQARAIESVDTGPVSHPDWETLRRGREGPLRMVLTFMGLYGVSSPLPSYFTDPITLKRREYFELRKFLDVFAHRFYSVFYRAWKKYRHQTQFREDGSDAYSRCLLALAGRWIPAPQVPASPEEQSDRLFALRRIRFARFFGHRVRSAKGLEQVLSGLFGFPRVRVRQFAPIWMPLPSPGRLGDPGTRLGATAFLGERMLDRTGAFVVEIGPLGRELFDLFLEGPMPGQSTQTGLSPLRRLVLALIEDYLLDPLDYRVEVLLDTRGEPPPALGSPRARLGSGIWLGEQAREAIRHGFAA